MTQNILNQNQKRRKPFNNDRDKYIQNTERPQEVWRAYFAGRLLYRSQWNEKHGVTDRLRLGV